MLEKKSGIDRGEKAFHIVDPNLREEHLERLSSAGIDVAAAKQSDRLEVRNWDELYVRDGHFCKDGMTALV